MTLFQQPIPRRAFFAAAIGALYALVLLLPPITLRSAVFAAAWLLLSVGLLFARPLAYHAFTFFAILWVAYRTILWFRERTSVAVFAVDLVMPLASLGLLLMSGYLDAIARDDPDAEGVTR